jgi:hypothetical protein
LPRAKLLPGFVEIMLAAEDITAARDAATELADVDDNHAVVALPLPDSSYPDPLRWTAVTGQDMRIAGAYACCPIRIRSTAA